jgi:hypothetical protein
MFVLGIAHRPRPSAQSLPFDGHNGHAHGYSRKSGKRRRQEAYQSIDPHGIDQQHPFRPDQRSESNQPPQPGRQIALRMDDKKAQAKWFSDAFKAVQQVGCRTIAKVWIKKIHPKKVSIPNICEDLLILNSNRHTHTMVCFLGTNQLTQTVRGLPIGLLGK